MFIKMKFVMLMLCAMAISTASHAQTTSAVGQASAPASPSTGEAINLTIPLSEATKLKAPPQASKQGQKNPVETVPAVQTVDAQGLDLQASGTMQKQIKKPKEIVLVRTAEVDGIQRALLKVNGVSANVEVGSAVLKYTVAKIDKNSICFSDLSKKSKTGCEKTIRFDFE